MLLKFKKNKLFHILIDDYKKGFYYMFKPLTILLKLKNPLNKSVSEGLIFILVARTGIEPVFHP